VHAPDYEPRIYESMASAAAAASAAIAPGAASSSAAPVAASSSAAPTPVVPAPANPATTLVVNPRQKGNPILKFVRNVTWAYGETPADYMMSESAGGLFLSLRYHQLHPNYLARRLGELLHHFTLRVVRPGLARMQLLVLPGHSCRHHHYCPPLACRSC
jgi:DNA excision repair protein ERCC-1